jgi:hypothetical protein
MAYRLDYCLRRATRYDMLMIPYRVQPVQSRPCHKLAHFLSHYKMPLVHFTLSRFLVVLCGLCEECRETDSTIAGPVPKLKSLKNKETCFAGMRCKLLQLWVIHRIFSSISKLWQNCKDFSQLCKCETVAKRTHFCGIDIDIARESWKAWLPRRKSWEARFPRRKFRANLV